MDAQELAQAMGVDASMEAMGVDTSFEDTLTSFFDEKGTGIPDDTPLPEKLRIIPFPDVLGKLGDALDFYISIIFKHPYWSELGNTKPAGIRGWSEGKKYAWIWRFYHHVHEFYDENTVIGMIIGAAQLEASSRILSLSGAAQGGGYRKTKKKSSKKKKSKKRKSKKR